MTALEMEDTFESKYRPKEGNPPFPLFLPLDVPESLEYLQPALWAGPRGCLLPLVPEEALRGRD